MEKVELQKLCKHYDFTLLIVASVVVHVSVLDMCCRQHISSTVFSFWLHYSIL